MRTNYHQICKVFFAVTVLVLLVNTFVHADTIYVSCCGSNNNNCSIEKFDSSGNKYTFTTDISSPLGLAFDSSGNLYVVENGINAIAKFDSSGNKSIFASGLDGPAGIAIQIPEPATLLLLGLGALVSRRKKD